MSAQSDLDRLTVGQFTDQFRGELIPLTSTFSYFTAPLPMSDDDVREHLKEPVAALPPAVISSLPRTSVLLVPYLERVNGRHKEGSGGIVAMEKPPEARAMSSLRLLTEEGAALFFAVRDLDIADYHYRFYHELAGLVADHGGEEPRSEFHTLLREELSANIHGEVDEESWRLKQALIRRSSTVRRESKAFREYARQSFIDTLTLYLHGICCDIDVDTGPRQLPSRFLRKRLMLLEDLYPPPEGYAVFPEDLKDKQ